jgi:MoaA/NifB/PqqE/SkfB family radical SAM enzyme
MMKITVFCEELRQMLIYELAAKTFCSEDIFFVGLEGLVTQSDILIVDHALANQLKKDETAGFGKIYVFFRDRLFDVSCADDLVEERTRLLECGDWSEAKNINEVLCDMDFLCRNTCNRSYPDFLQIESTDYCNSKCIMCDHYFSRNKNAQILGTETLEHLRDAIQLSRRINLNGIGEPFISKDIKSQIDYYVGYGNKIVANTNLSVLDDGLIERIANDFEWIAISIDGARKETYESIRIGMSYDTLLNNLEKLRRKAPHVKKIISMVIMRQNVCEMPEMIDLAHQYGVDQVVFLSLNTNLIIGNLRDSLLYYPKVAKYYSVKALQRGAELGVNVVVANNPGLDCELQWEDIQDELEEMLRLPLWKTPEQEQKMMEMAALAEDYFKTHKRLQDSTVPSKVRCAGVCDWLLKNCYTNLSGDISMCCRNLVYRAGNVDREGRFAEVWNAPLLRETRDIFYSGFVPESCLQCGMIESGELKYLSVDINSDFYLDTQLRQEQKKEIKRLLGENHGV